MRLFYNQRRRDRAASASRERSERWRKRGRIARAWLGTVLGILVALVAAESLSVGVAHFAGYDFSLQIQPAPILTLIFGNILSSFAIAVPVRAAADRDGGLWRQLETALTETTRPDSGYYTQRVFLQPDRTKGRFKEDIENIPGDKTEVLVLLKQTVVKQKKDSENHAYSISNMQEQIGPLLDRKDLGRFKWVCFLTRDGEFVAYQEFLGFALALKFGSKQEYERILNTGDVASFKNRLRDHRLDKWNGQTGFSDPDSIIGLEFGCIDEGILKKETLVAMAVCGDDDGPVVDNRNHLMLVDKRKRPVGIVTPRELLKSALLKVAVTKKEQDEICKRIKIDDGDHDQTESSVPPDKSDSTGQVVDSDAPSSDTEQLSAATDLGPTPGDPGEPFSANQEGVKAVAEIQAADHEHDQTEFTATQDAVDQPLKETA